LIGDKRDEGRGEVGAGAAACAAGEGERGAGGREDAWEERVDVGREEVIKADSVVMLRWVHTEWVEIWFARALLERGMCLCALL
jgi:hypothetical protein